METQQLEPSLTVSYKQWLCLAEAPHPQISTMKQVCAFFFFLLLLLLQLTGMKFTRDHTNSIFVIVCPLPY